MRRRAVLTSLAALGLQGCRPLIQLAGSPPLGFSGPRLEHDALISFDGARLPMKVWAPEAAAGATTPPWAVIIGLHGMNDYAQAFGLAGPYWASLGVTTYAYDQRGFGRAPERGIWGGSHLMGEDLCTAVALARQRHPLAVIAVVGESMGGAVAITAFASSRPPAADRLILAAPAVWGWSAQAIPNRMALWLAAHAAPGRRIAAPNWLARRIHASDNLEELRRMGRDRNMIFATRIDTIYGLVDLMQQACEQLNQVKAPVLFLYGAHDQLIPRAAALDAARGLKPGDRSAYYADGYHLLLRDLQRRRVWDDVLSFIRQPAAELPSRAPPVPAGRSPGPAAVPPRDALAGGEPSA